MTAIETVIIVVELRVANPGISSTVLTDITPQSTSEFSFIL